MRADVREMERADVPETIRLMRALAAFEGYIDDFAVSEFILERRAFAAVPDFSVFVCGPPAGRLVGYAVSYWVNWTYTLKPTLVLKELYVDAASRGSGVGAELFERVRRQAEEGGAGRLEWLVLPGNAGAERFYRAQGAAPDPSWDRWGMSL